MHNLYVSEERVFEIVRQLINEKIHNNNNNNNTILLCLGFMGGVLLFKKERGLTENYLLCSIGLGFLGLISRN